jgi:hypothetical protein
MKKLIQQIKEAYNVWQKEQTGKDQQKEKELELNQMFNLVFKEKTTAEAIELKEKFDSKFQAEISERNINAVQESFDCEYYLNKQLVKWKSQH